MNTINTSAMRNEMTSNPNIFLHEMKNPNANKCKWKLITAIGLSIIILLRKYGGKIIEESSEIRLRDDADRRKKKEKEEEDNKPENLAKREAQDVENRVCETLGLRRTKKPIDSPFLADDVMADTPVFLVKNFLRQDERVIIYSGTGVGKTILAIQIAIALSMGWDIEFLPAGTTLSKPMKVILFDAEMENCDISNRYSKLKKSLPPNEIATLNRNFRRLHDCHFPTIYHFLEELIDWAGKIDRDTVFIIDNLTKIVPGTLTGQVIQDYYNGLRSLQRICAERGIKLTFITVNHTTKDKDVMTGSCNISNFATNVYQIQEDASDKSLRYIKSEKRRWGQKESFSVCIKEEPYLHFESAEKPLKDIPVNEEKNVGKRHGGRPALSQEQVDKIHQLHSDGLSGADIAKSVGCSEMTVSRYCK